MRVRGVAIACLLFCSAVVVVSMIPHSALAATHGSIDSDTSFEVTVPYAGYQNLGNGNFTSGAAITGFDIRASTTPGLQIYAGIQGYSMYSDGSSMQTPYAPATTTAGDTVYHFDVPPFVPAESTCYVLFFGLSGASSVHVSYYGWSNDTYTASYVGCSQQFKGNDVATEIQSPVLSGHGVRDYSFVIYDDGNVAPPPPPIEPQGKTYGDLGYDFSFTLNPGVMLSTTGSMSSSPAAFQNLGRGSFAEGNTVTGVDIRWGTVPGNYVGAHIREFDEAGHAKKSYVGETQQTHEGNTVYHFDLPEFTPNPNYCYQLVYVQQYLNVNWPTTYYGHSQDVYVASSTNCKFGKDSDDYAPEQNNALDVPGYYDYSFRIHTDGATSTAPTSTPACTENCFSNVLFLPGIESSRLYRPQVVGADEEKLWEPFGDNDVRDLFLKKDGTSNRTDIYTKEGDVLDEISANGQNIYKSFIDKMDELKSTGMINDWKPAAYDWRLSLDEIVGAGNAASGKIYYAGAEGVTSTPYILAELRRLAASSKTGKVTIIAHSNGGLVAKRLTEVLGPDAAQLIDKMIFVAVPQAGTPMAVAAGMHGFDQAKGPGGSFMSAAIARSFASTSPMFYHLLPSAQYFTYVDDPIIQFDPSLTDWIDRYGAAIHSGEGMHNFLTDSYERVDAETGSMDQPTQLKEPLLDSAETLHSDLDNWTPPTGVELIQIAGWGVPTTVSGLTYKKKGSAVKGEPNFTIDGDGTVVVPSALWTSATASTTNYWVDLNDYNNEHFISTLGGHNTFDHSKILEVSDVVNFLADTLLFRNDPISKYQYFSQESPASTDIRLRYALHSPLTLDAFDNHGNHTGISTTTHEIEEGIPGSYYKEYGDVKYLFTDPDVPVHIVMTGYATSTFTFVAEELTGDEARESTTWQDMPVTPETEAALDQPGDFATLSPLTIDKNGDGVIDYNLPPQAGGIVTLPKPQLTVTADDKAIMLGQPIPALTATLSGFVDGEPNDVGGEAACTTTAQGSSGVGVYPITCTVGTLTSDTYDFSTFAVGALRIEYRWEGFLPPIDKGHQDANIFKAGSTVPVKFELRDFEGELVDSSMDPEWMMPQQLGPIDQSPDTSNLEEPETSSEVFKKVSGQYQYNWKTKGYAPGYWYRVSAKLDDGNIYYATVGLK